MPMVNRMYVFLFTVALLRWSPGQQSLAHEVLTKPPGCDQHINYDYLNVALIEETILYFVNVERQNQGKSILCADTLLALSARLHSQEMASLHYLKHESPSPQNKTLRNRLNNVGIELPGSKYGENLGVDYVLHIAGIPFITKWITGKARYYYSDGRQEIQPQTYEHFAKGMVSSWMQSPGHKANLLEADFTHIGIGAAKGKYNKLNAIYVTQNFWGKNPEALSDTDTLDHFSH